MAIADRVVYMSSTEAQNGFGRMIESVARGSTVLITRHNTTQAVVMSVERYEELTRSASADLDTLTAEFDEMLQRMQTAGAQEALRDAFRASPDELSRAAVAAARRR
jgi:antitoxin Phd